MWKRMGLILMGMILGVLALGVGERVRGVVSKAGGGDANTYVTPMVRCSNASLNGNYTLTSNGERSEGVADPRMKIEMIGLMTFDGNGKLSGKAILKWGIQDKSATAITGKYSVNSDCLGTFTVSDGKGGTPVWTFSMLVVNGGNQAEFIAVDGPANMIGTLKKQ